MAANQLKIRAFLHLIRHQSVFCILIFTIGLLALPAKADWDPSLHFHTLKTRHFDIYYYDGEAGVAQRVARLAEPVLQRVSRFLHMKPPRIIHVLVTDTVDSANGSARVFPYTLVVVQPYPPPSFGQLANFDDYLRVLLTHELTHILHMNTKRGIPAFVDRIFGNLWFPNYAHPALLMEGLAVLAESRLNRGGRLYSPFFEMLLRAERKAHNIPGLSRVTMVPTRLPRGTSPYLYGAYFMDFLARHFGMDRIAAYFKAYGGVIIPFAHNILARRVFHRSLVKLYREFLAELRRRLDGAIRRISKQGLTRLRWLTKNGEFHASPLITPTHRTCYVQDDAKSREAIVCQAPGQRPKRLITCFGGCGGLRWSCGLHGILTTHTTPFRNVMSYADVFVVHEDGTEQRITTGARARNPVQFMHGIAFVRATTGRNAISWTDFQGKKVRDLVKGNVFDSISDLAVYGSRLYFAASRHGNWDIYAWSQAQGILRLTTGNWIDIMPRPSPQGRYLYYVSTRDGVYNIYRMPLHGTPRTCRLTNVIGGAFWPLVTRDRVLAVVYTNRGFDVARITLTNSGKCFALQPWQRVTHALALKAKKSIKPSNYNPLSFFIPTDYLMPVFSMSGTSITDIGLEAKMQDATSRHFLDLGISTDPKDPYPDFEAAYTFGGWWADVGLYGGLNRAFFRSRPGGRQVVTTTGRHGSVGMFIALPLRARSHNLSMSLDTAVEFNRPGRTGKVEYDPMFTPVFSRSTTTINTRFRLSYSSVTAYPYSVAPQDGWVSGFRIGLRNRPQNGDWALTFMAYLSGYFTPFWARTHSIEFSVYAGASRGHGALRSVFALGGPVWTSPLDALVNQRALPSALMRGFKYGSIAGDTFWAGTLQYNLPLVRFDRGLGSLPLYFRYLAGDVFVDAGSAFFQGMAPGPPQWSAGAEVWLTLAPALMDNFKILLGFAYARRPVVYFSVGY